MLETDLRYFLAIVEHRSLSRAAEELGVAQPTLSRSVQRIERRLDVRLFERTPRGVELTEAGRRLAQSAQSAALVLEDAARELKDMASGRRGRVRVATGHTISNLVTSALVPRLQRERPAAVLQLDAHFNDQIVLRLEEGAYDFGVGVIPDGLSSALVAVTILHDDLVPAVDERHPLASHPAPTAADLVKYPWTGAASRVLSYAAMRQLFIDARVEPPTDVLVTNSYETSITAVRNSDFVMFAPRWLVRRRVGRYAGLATVEIPGFAHRRPLGMLRRRNAYLSPIAERAYEMVEQALRDAGKVDSA